jgi:hypothetical protein
MSKVPTRFETKYMTSPSSLIHGSQPTEAVFMTATGAGIEKVAAAFMLIN